MKIDRKTFIQNTSLATAGMLITRRFTSDPSTTPIKAIVFDGFAILDPRPVFKTIEQLFPEKAKEVIDAWQSRQFTYQWLRVLGERYKNFREITKDALDFSLVHCGLYQRDKERDLIMAKYEALNVWPDVVPVLQKIKKMNLKVCFLSNMTSEMLRRGIQNSGLDVFFDFVISTDEIQTYKPSTNAYEMALDKLGLRKQEILFVPFAAWDMAGAKWFGYPTFWVNRLDSSPENLDAEPDGHGKDLGDVVDFVRKCNN